MTERTSKKINKRKDLLTILLIIGATLVVLAGVLWVFGNFSEPKPVADEKAKLATYLEAKYGKEFVIKSAKIYTPLFDEEDIFEAKVRPIDNSSDEVTVYKEPYHSAASYKENYLGLMWQKQETPGLKKHLETIYTAKTMPQYLLQITATDEYIATVNGRTPRLEEAVAAFGPDAAQVYLSIDQTAFKNDQNLDRAAEEITKITPYIKKLNKDSGWTYTLDGDKKYRCQESYLASPGDHAALATCLKEAKL